MIPKGNQRAGGQQLATHLLNEYDNDLVQVAEVRGAIAPDLHGAFAEWYAQAKATNCRKYLYSLSINPDHTQGPFSRKHYDDFIARTEKRLGLAGQPRAVVFHVKHGREHCHVVWSRIDTDKMKAVQLSHDRQKLRAVAQEYARDHNLTLPPGMQNDRGKDRFPDHQKTENLAEKQQEERSGISKQQRREQITKIWRESADARSFIKALDAAGYCLARGDQRAYVVVDLYGEVHSLSRQLIGVKGKEMKQRLSAYPTEKLPSILDAQDDARERRQALIAKELEEKPKTLQERRDELQRAQALRRGKLDARREQLVQRHAAERKALSDLQSARSTDIARDRAAKQPKGVLALLSRITGFNALTAFRHARQDRQTEQVHREQKGALARRHAREMENFRHHDRGLTALEKRERRSLETALRREIFRTIAAPARTRTPVPELTPAQARALHLAEAFRAASAPRRPGQKSFALTPEQEAKIAAFKRTAAELNTPTAGRAGAPIGKTAKPPDKISPKFKEAARAAPARPSDSLSAKFNDKAEKPLPARSAQTGEKKSSLPPREKSPADAEKTARLREIKENAADLTAAQRRALDLATTFKESAAPPRRKKERDQDGQGRTDTDRDKHYRPPVVDYSIRR